VTTLITHRSPIEDAVKAFGLAQGKSKGVFRVVVEPS
jgi:threonine dehydrogenase-like Zn-dependent dehydrogenase